LISGTALAVVKGQEEHMNSAGGEQEQEENPVSLHNNNEFAHGSILKKQMSK
jgi:hypothetical protein